MKQHTTPKIVITVPNQELLLSAASRIVVVAESSAGNQVKWEGDAISVEGSSITFIMNQQESAQLDSQTKFEATIFVGDNIYKTETITARIDQAVWDNGD